MPIPLAQAERIGADLVARLAGVSVRAEIVGSVRRRKPEVKDLELLVDPRPGQAAMFEEPEPDHAAVRAEVRSWGRVVKSGPRYTQVVLPEGVTVDVFVVIPPADWFVQQAIRTGPWQLSKAAVAWMKRSGYRCDDARLLLHGRPVELSSEADFFAAAGMECQPPERRDAYALRLGVV